jgi:hypothetical protein
MSSLDFLGNVMASHHYVATAEAVERAASLWRGHPPADRSDITQAFAEHPEMFTPDGNQPSRHDGHGVDSGFDPPPTGAGSPGVESPRAGEPMAASPGSASVSVTSERAKALHKVRDLMAVAVGHANDNEARANAVIACKLILEHDLLRPA